MLEIPANVKVESKVETPTCKLGWFNGVLKQEWEVKYSLAYFRDAAHTDYSHHEHPLVREWRSVPILL